MFADHNEAESHKHVCVVQNLFLFPDVIILQTHTNRSMLYTTVWMRSYIHYIQYSPDLYRTLCSLVMNPAGLMFR